MVDRGGCPSRDHPYYITAPFGSNRDVVIELAPGTASSLDASDVAGGDDIGSTGVFVPEVDVQQLTLSAEDGGFGDDETGSTWNILGTATSGPLAGSQPGNGIISRWVPGEWLAPRPMKRRSNAS